MYMYVELFKYVTNYLFNRMLANWLNMCVIV